jgi:hypothetical protein
VVASMARHDAGPSGGYGAARARLIARARAHR